VWRVRGDDAGVDEEGNELVPREVMCGGSGIGEIEARRPAMRRGWVYVGAMEDLEETWFVVTGFMSHTGYSMSGVVCAACLETFLGLGRKKRSYLHHRPSSHDFRH